MTVDPQQTHGSTVAGGNTPTYTPNVPVNPTDTVDYWKSQFETMQGKYNGQQTAMNKKSEEVKDWQQKHAALSADFEGFKGTYASEKSDWEKGSKGWEAEKGELSTKLKGYELTDKVRSLVHTDFAELASDFEADPIYRAGILSAAQQMDADGLKKALTDSLNTRKGRQQEVLDRSLQGSTTPPPMNGAPSGTSAEQILQKMMTMPVGSAEFKALEDLLVEAERKKH